MRRFLAVLLSGVALTGATASPALAASDPGRQAGPPALLASITGLVGNLANPAPGADNPVDGLTGAAASLALGVFASGVLGGAGSALRETAHVISRTTAPRLQSTWFSATYWRVAGLAALLSLPFLFAAAAQALLRADPLLLVRSVFGFLPLAVIAVNLAAPITMLLLSATDAMCAVISGAGMSGGVRFLEQTAQEITGLSALDGSPFLGIAVGLITLAAAVALAVEMLIRAAAVYVVVLMLPLAFAGLIWPARRSWAVRLIELLTALILSKFVIVAVLSLAGAASGSSGSPTATRLLTAMTLVMLSTFAPWVMLRLLPFTELAAGAAGGIRGELPRLARIPRDARAAADTVADWAETLPQLLRRQAGEPGGGEETSLTSAGQPVGGESALSERRLGQNGGSGETTGRTEIENEDVDRPEGPAGNEAIDPIDPNLGTASGAPSAPEHHRSGAPSAPEHQRRSERHPGMDWTWQYADLERPPMTLDADEIRRLRESPPAGPELPEPDPLGAEAADPDPGKS